MFLIYYYIPKTEERRWIMAETEENAKTFIEEHDIKDYCVTVNEQTYEKMKNKIEYQEQKIEDIKKSLKDIIKEV